jgi:dihydrolipoamide dehydrogenase
VGIRDKTSRPFLGKGYSQIQYQKSQKRLKMKKYDVIVIGAGPGGYECASVLAKEGKNVCIIEKNEMQLGGTCLNEGCVPAKQYLETASYLAKSSYAQSCGIDVKKPHLDISLLKKKKDELTQQLRSGIQTKLKKVQIIFGDASFKDENTLLVANEEILFEHCVIATGSIHRPHPTLEVDGNLILSSKEIFELQTLPRKILIVGGGAIGCEFATFFNAAGVEVVLAEFTPTLVPNEDKDVAQTLERELKKKGIRVHVNTNVTNHIKNQNSIEVTLQTPKEELQEEFDFVLVSIGRMPNTCTLNLNNAKIQTQKDFILTNKHLQTSNPHIYAIGDVIKTPALAHMAYNEALTVANNLTKETLHVSAVNVPFVTFCQPQVASVGKNEKTLTQEGREFIVKKHFYKSSAKAKIKGDDSGFIKLLVDKNSDEILGGSMVGNEVTELIHQILIAINAKLTCKDLAKMVFAHPTLSESLWEMLN